MEIKELYHLTNSASIEYLSSKKDWVILGIEECFYYFGNSFLIVLENSLKNEEEKVICVYCLPSKNSNSFISFFMGFEHFCIYVGCTIAGIKITYNYLGSIEWPTYRGSKKQMDIFFEKYTELHKKYDKYVKK